MSDAPPCPDPRPRKGTAEHRAWLLDVLAWTAAELGKPLLRMPRSHVEAARPEDARYWPAPDDWLCLGGYRAAQRLAADAHTPDEMPSTAELGERRAAQRDRLYTARLERELGDVRSLDERLRACLADAIDARGGVAIAAPRAAAPVFWEQPSQREVVVFLSDTHWGAHVDPREVPGSRYDWTIAARRLAVLVSQACSYHPSRRAQTSCRLLVGGDVIEGAIHLDDRGTALLAQQIDGAAQLLTHAIDRLRDAFQRVEVTCLAGNHDRWPHKGPGRASAQKWDSALWSVFHGLARTYRDCDDVRVEVPTTPYAAPLLCGVHRLWLTHGDTVTHAGTPGKRIDVQRLTAHLHALDAARLFPEPVSVVCLGHYHVPLWHRTGSGAHVIVNGSASGLSTYAQSLGIHAGAPVQWLLESTSQWPVGDARQVDVAQGDEDARFDAIIPRPANVD